MDDKEILGRIDELIATEHDLRSRLAAGELTSADEREQLRAAEEHLDQAWDLLRQRRGRRDPAGARGPPRRPPPHAGEDPAGSQTRPVTEVEGYLQ
jgi:uncharacterized membrane protein YccC